MPRKARELTALDVRRLRHPGGQRPVTFAVGGVSGLLIQVTITGARSWLLRIRAGGRRREIGLGGFPDVGLAEAREKARAARAKLEAGIDPVEERRAAQIALAGARARSMTFGEAVERYLEKRTAEFRSEKHRKQWRATLDLYAAPHIGAMEVQAIALQDLLRVLEPIWTSKTETATRVRGRVEAVLNWAAVSGYRTGDNPARWKGNLDAILPAAARVADAENHPAVSLDDAPRWFAALRLRAGMAARALEFLTLCASRSGEVRGATWNEIDLDKRLWTIPAPRMKARKEHRVPLSQAALLVLANVPRSESEFVFWAPRAGALSDMTLSAVMRRMQETEAKEGRPGYLDRESGRPAVPHGLRSTFRDWCAERTEYPGEMAEVALAHRVGSAVELAYRRGDMIERRRAMMEAWAMFLGWSG